MKKTFNIVDELISDGIGPNGSGGVSSWNDLTDKPFGEKTTVLEILQERTFTEQYTSISAIFTNAGLGDGDEVIVVCDGEEYVESIKIDMGISAYYVGGLSERPYYIKEYSGIEGQVEIAEGATHTISIYAKKAEVVPLDPKYIQLTSPNGTKYNLAVANDGTLSATRV